MTRTSHSYYVVMQDLGKLGLEAIVQPEVTRRAVIENIQHGEYKHVVFIHHVDGLIVEDVTNELFNEAEVGLRTFDRPDEIDHQAAAWDRARKLRVEA